MRELSRLAKSSFARDVTRLASGTAAAQVVALVALPVITRLYTPDQFGAAAAFISVTMIVAVVSSLRYDLGIPLPRSDRSAMQVAFLALGCLFVVAACAGVVSLWTDIPSAMLFVAILAVGAYKIGSRWAARKGDFRTVATTRVHQGVGGAGSQIAFGLLGFGTTGLIAGQIIGHAAGAVRLLLAFFKAVREAGAVPQWRRMVWTARRYRNFPIYDAAAGLLNTLGVHAPVLLLTAFFSPSLAGFYTLSVRGIAAPTSLVGSAVSQVLLPRIVSEHRKGSAGAFLRGVSLRLAWGMVPFAVVAALAPQAVKLAFGPEWQGAAFVLSWTAAWGSVQFVASPLSVALLGLERQRLNAVLQTVLLSTRAAAMGIGILLGSAETAIILFSLASIGSYIAFIVAIGRVVGREMVSPLLLPALLAGAVFVLASSI